MFGRMDVSLDAICLSCNGKGLDRKNRKRTCPDCGGSGKSLVCTTCGQRMPCPGTQEGVMDQDYCTLKISIYNPEH